MLDAREPQPVGVDHAGLRVHTDQPVVPDERHASAADQTAPELDQPGAHRRAQSGPGRAHPGPVVRHPLHPHPVPSRAQDHRGNGLPDILGGARVDPSECRLRRRRFRACVRVPNKRHRTGLVGGDRWREGVLEETRPDEMIEILP